MPDKAAASAKKDHSALAVLQESLLKRAYANGGFGHAMLCAEVLQQVSTLSESSVLSPQKQQTRKKHKGRHSAELKFRVSQGVLERIDEESVGIQVVKRSRNNLQRKSVSYDFDSIQTIKRESLRVRRSRLEEDIQRLHIRLQSEITLHEALETAITEPSGSIPQHLPQETRELLADIARHEAVVTKLEDRVLQSRWQIDQERQERKSLEDGLRNLRANLRAPLSRPTTAFDTPFACSPSTRDISVEHRTDCDLEAARKSVDDCFDNLALEVLKNKKSLSRKNTLEDPVLSSCSDEDAIGEEWKHHKRISWQTNDESCRISPETPPQQAPPLLSRRKLCPNKLSENMIECMMDIYCHLSDSAAVSSSSSPLTRISSPTSPFTHATTSSISSLSESSLLPFARSPFLDLRNKEEVVGSESLLDPYRTREKLSWLDIGMYCSAVEIRWISVGKEQLGYAAQALRNYKSLVENLAKVDVRTLTHAQKVAFWINIYNALLMHSFLAYGIPKSELNTFSLMQKASYVIGGHVLTALNIEYHLLKHKPPIHRPQVALLLALQKTKLTAEQNKLAIDVAEPLTVFALGNGARSSPVVKAYAPDNLQQQLKASLHDYVRASVGLSVRGKLLIPRLLYTYAHETMDDSSMLEWIFLHLPSSQVTVIQECLQQRRHKFLSSRNFGILPFDSKFQYLILPSSSRKRIKSSSVNWS